MNAILKVGQEIPNFESKDFEGHPITKEDFLGEPFVIYFYPKNDTSHCTKEACDFRDMMDSFDDFSVMVVGVSSDPIESHQKFMDKYELNFPLISDEEGKMAKLFGALEEKSNGTFDYIRSTFICDQDGIVQWVESPVNVEGHVDRVLAAIDEVMA